MTLSLFLNREPSGVFSECTVHTPCPDPYCTGRPYRYQLLLPTGVDNDRMACACLANPSDAVPDMDRLDPTMVRWVTRCRTMGFGWALTVNARAWRQTIASLVPPDPVAIGPDNDHWIADAVEASELVVCGWGKFGKARGAVCLDIIRKAGKAPHALRLNGDGSPCHPLYLPLELKPFPMPGFGDAKSQVSR